MSGHRAHRTVRRLSSIRRAPQPEATGGIATRPPGSSAGLQLVVSDIEAAHAQLVDRGVEASDVQDFPWGRFVFFSDPDGNRWSVQQIPPRP
jgi:uncharacterized glyoxalase superfamily protein PhnB